MKRFFIASIFILVCSIVPAHASEAGHVLGPLENLVKVVGLLVLVGLVLFLLYAIVKWYRN